MTSEPLTGVGEANTSTKNDKVDDGALCEIQTLYEGPPPQCKCCTNWVEEYPEDVRLNIEEQEQSKQKALIVRMRKTNGAGEALAVDSIVVQNNSLKQTIESVFEGYKNITPSLKKLVFKAPFHPFFYQWKRLENILEKQKLDDPKAAAYTQILYDILEAEFREVRAELDDLLANGVITHPLLWAIFEPGTRIVTGANTPSTRFYIVESCVYNNWETAFHITATWVDSNGQALGYVKKLLSAMMFYDGTKNITELTFAPSHFFPQIQEMEAMAIARGRRFVELHGCHYVAYSGNIKLKKDSLKEWDRRVGFHLQWTFAEAYFSNVSLLTRFI